MSTALLTRPVGPSVGLDELVDAESIDDLADEDALVSTTSARTASRIQTLLGHFVLRHNLGEVVTEAIFRLPLARPKNRKPDVAFIPQQRWPFSAPLPSANNAWPVVPAMVVEVVSPSDRLGEAFEKVREYFDAGVDMVWVLEPVQRLVYIYSSPTAIQVLTASDQFDGGTLFPGFSVPIADLIAPIVPEPSQPDTIT